MKIPGISQRPFAGCRHLWDMPGIRLFLFYRKSEFSDLFSKLKIFTMVIGYQSCPVQFQASVFVHEIFVHIHGLDPGYEHVMGSQLQLLYDPAFDIDRGLLDKRCLYG